MIRPRSSRQREWPHVLRVRFKSDWTVPILRWARKVRLQQLDRKAFGTVGLWFFP
jgi:hypothetical protein